MEAVEKHQHHWAFSFYPGLYLSGSDEASVLRPDLSSPGRVGSDYALPPPSRVSVRVCRLGRVRRGGQEDGWPCQPLPLLFGAPGSPACTVASPAPSPSRDAWLMSSVLPGAGTSRHLCHPVPLPSRSRASLISRSPPAAFKLPALAPGAPSRPRHPGLLSGSGTAGAHSRPERSPSSDARPVPAAPHLPIFQEGPAFLGSSPPRRLF